MTEDEHHRQNPPPTNPKPPPAATNFSTKLGDLKPTSSNFNNNHNKYPNPPEITNPDSATLRQQWKYAIRQYSKWYSHAWGTAILAGLSFFALGWVIKGENPIPSFHTPSPQNDHVLADSPSDPKNDTNPNPHPSAN